MNEHEECGMLIKQINDQLEKDANNALRSEDLTLIQASVLLELEQRDHQTASMKEIEKFLGVAQPTAVGIIRRMELKKLVEAFQDPNDKRVKLVHMTKIGREKAQYGKLHMKEAAEKMMKPLSDQEKAQFSNMLLRVRDSLKGN